MKKILLTCSFLSLSLSGATALSATNPGPVHPLAEALATRGVTGTVQVRTGCFSCFMTPKVLVDDLRDCAGVVGGHLKTAAGATARTVLQATPFILLTLEMLKASKVDVPSEVGSIVRTAQKASNLTTLLLSNTGVLTSFSADGTSTGILDPKDALIKALGSTPLSRFLGQWAGAFMPDDYSAGPGFTPTQNAIAYTLEVLSLYQSGSVTGELVLGGIRLSAAGKSLRLNTALSNHSIPFAGYVSRNSDIFLGILEGKMPLTDISTVDRNTPAASVALPTFVPASKTVTVAL